MTTLLSLSGISKTFDNGVEAIALLDLNVAEREFVSLVGPSGCGKSTALRIAAGAGRAGGKRRGGARFSFPKGRPEAVFVFQEPALMPGARALKNVRLPLDLRGMNAGEADDRASAALARAGLKGFENA